MKISDFIFSFKGDVGRKNNVVCRVRYFIGKENRMFVLITDIGDLYPLSPSITNSIENICGSLINKGLVSGNAIFIEHYEENAISDSTFDIIEFNTEKRITWKSIRKEKVKELLECGDGELADLTEKNKRLIAEIEKIKYSINPESDFHYPESADVIRRKIEINENKISKQQLEETIENRAKEEDIASLIKKDLSIIAEVYANPKDEYICFSEFPIKDGYVDYVLLTGRSRMNVYLIEIKGADFNLTNKNNSKFNEKISEAEQQINTRYGFIYRNYEYFRKYIHDIKRRVENGEKIYNSFIGPVSKLEVDSEKDIHIYTVVIGGRTHDDYFESELRHNWEAKNSIKLETWDTFTRKLIRE